MLDYVLQFKGESKRIIKKSVENIFYLLVQKGSGFDSFVVLEKLPKWITVVSLIKNGSSIVSVKKIQRLCS